MINQNAVEAVFERSLKLRPEESCLIVTDTIKEPIARVFYEYVIPRSSESKLAIIPPAREHASPPPEEVARMMLDYDVELLITQKSLTHTRARMNASRAGARIATMPSITEEIANRCLDIDYTALKKESSRICDLLRKTKKVRVTTSLGTDITFDANHAMFFGENGGSFSEPGAFGNLPEGEVAFAPLSCEGIYVVDASFPDLGRLSSPLTFKVKNGVVYEITGCDAPEVIERLEHVGAKAYRVAELGIGLNPKAIVTGNILEDEKAAGTVHIAVGNNLFGGGDNDVPLHLDGVILSPDVYFDGKKFIETGKFLSGYPKKPTS